MTDADLILSELLVLRCRSAKVQGKCKKCKDMHCAPPAIDLRTGAPGYVTR
jgi:hypothetical protein